MLYDEERIKRLRGFTLGIFGSFIFAFSSVLAILITGSYMYLGIAAMSMGTIILAYLAIRCNSIMSQVIYVLSTGSMLATEASILLIYFNSFTSLLYALITLLGSGLALKGIRDIESFKEERSQRQREEIAKFQSGFT